MRARRKCAIFHGVISDLPDDEVQFWHAENKPQSSGIADKMSALQMHRIRGAEKRLISAKNMTFHRAMEMHGIAAVDFLSLDTEGSEMDILRSINFSSVPVKVIAVENSWFTFDIRRLLIPRGFSLVGRLGHNEIYVNRAAMKSDNR